MDSQMMGGGESLGSGQVDDGGYWRMGRKEVRAWTAR